MFNHRLLENYGKYAFFFPFVITEMKSEPEGNSALTRSRLIDTFPEKLSTFMFKKNMFQHIIEQKYTNFSLGIFVLDWGKQIP